jgi:aspartate 1-decarboxylase
LIIVSYVQLEEHEIGAFVPSVVVLGEGNRIKTIK